MESWQTSSTSWKIVQTTSRTLPKTNERSAWASPDTRDTEAAAEAAGPQARQDALQTGPIQAVEDRPIEVQPVFDGNTSAADLSHPKQNPKGDTLNREITNDTGTLYCLPRKELERRLQEAKASDQEKLVMALGEDGAARWNKLERISNSTTDLDRADAASAELQKIEDRMTDNQKRLVFGIGDISATADDIASVLEAHQHIGPYDSPENIAWETSLAFRRVQPKETLAVPQGKSSAAAQQAYLRLMLGYQALQKQGISKEKIEYLICYAMINRSGISPGDASDIIRSFMKAASYSLQREELSLVTDDLDRAHAERVNNFESQ